jgi:hypothetical protein
VEEFGMTKCIRENKGGKEAAAIHQYVDFLIMTIESPLLLSPIHTKKCVIPKLIHPRIYL